jgi:hypothetical protein
MRYCGFGVGFFDGRGFGGVESIRLSTSSGAGPGCSGAGFFMGGLSAWEKPVRR